MSLSLTDRLVELKNAQERQLISNEEYRTMRSRLLESFTTAAFPPRPKVSSTAPTSPTSPTSPSNTAAVRASVAEPLQPPRPPPPPLASLSERVASPLASPLASPQVLPSAITAPLTPAQSPVRLSSPPLRPVLRQARPMTAFQPSDNAPPPHHRFSRIFDDSVPDMPPPPYTPPEPPASRRRRTSVSFFALKPKTAEELRKDIVKLTEASKRERDALKREEARLRLKVGTKPEEIQRVRRKQRECSEKYSRRLEAVQNRLRTAEQNE